MPSSPPLTLSKKSYKLFGKVGDKSSAALEDTVSSTIAKLCNNQELSDIQICVKDKSRASERVFNGNAAIYSVHSSVLKHEITKRAHAHGDDNDDDDDDKDYKTDSVCKCSSSSSSLRELELNMSIDGFAIANEYMYGYAECEIDTEQLMNVLSVATLLKLEPLVKQCQIYVNESLANISTNPLILINLLCQCHALDIDV